MNKVQLAPVKFFRKWVKALRSGKYKQTQNTLVDSESHCCLGVACALKAQENRDKNGKVRGLRTYGRGDKSEYAGEWLMPDRFQVQLGELNDRGDSFDHIADVIEEKFITNRKTLK